MSLLARVRLSCLSRVSPLSGTTPLSAMSQSVRRIGSVCSPTVGLDEEQTALYDSARSFADRELAPFMKEWDEKQIFPVDTMRKAAELGYATIYVPDEHGGTGLTRLDTSIIFDAMSTGCVSTTAFMSIHNMCAWILSSYGSQSLIDTHMPSLNNMSKFASYCLTEPNSGSDAASLQTSAKKDGDVYIVNGAKAFISGGGDSDFYFVMVRTGVAGPKGISCLLIEKGMKGVGFGAKERKVGWSSQPTRVVTFDEVRVPVSNLLGEEGEGFSIAMKGLNGGRVNIASCSLGAAQAALEKTADHVKVRKQFNKSIASFQNTQFKFAEMGYALNSSRLMVRQAARMIDDAHPSAAQWCAMAKMGATESGFEICDSCLQLHGGYGYLLDYPIQQYWRDSRVHRILEGTNEVMRMIVGREMLKE